MDQMKNHVANAKGWNVADLQIAPDHLDMGEATDLIHLPTDARVSLRCRTEQHRERYFGQFTVRMSGSPSEWDKLQARNDYTMLYCFKDAQQQILNWWVIDLRPAAFDYILGDFWGDDSYFRAFRIKPATVLASSEPFPTGLFYRLLQPQPDAA